MATLKIGVVGRIVAGEETGRYVEILDDSAATGGFLVCLYQRPDRSGEGFDYWVEKIEHAQAFLDDCGMEVEWLE